jgi:hypothetical protein
MIPPVVAGGAVLASQPAAARFLEAAGAAWVALPAQTPGTLDFVTPFLNVGITGILLLMLVFGKGIVPAWSYERALQRIEKLEAEKAGCEERVRESTALLIDKVVPLMTRAVDVETQLLDAMREDERRDVLRDVGRSPSRRG